MRKTVPISIYLDTSSKDVLQRMAGERRMNLSSYCTHLMTRGIIADDVETIIARLHQAAGQDVQREVLRQVLATRYIVEAQAKGDIKLPHMVGSFANEHAERELNKLWPKEQP